VNLTFRFISHYIDVQNNSEKCRAVTVNALINALMH